MRRTELPGGHRSGAFRVRDGMAHGISRNRLMASDLDRSVWGVRQTKRVGDVFLRRLEAYAARLRPDAFFSHATAARLLGIPLPLRVEREGDVHVSVHAPDRAPHANGLRGHRLAAETRVITHLGLRVTSPSNTWRDLGSVLSMVELVAAGDHIIHHRAPLAERAELVRVVRGPRRGLLSLRAALDYLDERSESPPESELRVLLALGGLPRPRANQVIVETESGHDVRVDFAYDEYLFAIEYQGDYHRSRAQWRKDMTRRTRLESMGWYVMELNADDLRDPAELVSRIRAAMSRKR